MDANAIDLEDDRTVQVIREEKIMRFCLPQISASKRLNLMIRLLLMRLPQSQLIGL